jgi:hypothetical protein
MIEAVPIVPGPRAPFAFAADADGRRATTGGGGIILPSMKLPLLLPPQLLRPHRGTVEAKPLDGQRLLLAHGRERHVLPPQQRGGGGGVRDRPGGVIVVVIIIVFVVAPVHHAVPGIGGGRQVEGGEGRRR